MIGFLLVDKPAGPTSHDVVDAARKALGVRRVGHAGTLDPPASGLVVCGVGPATRLLRFVQGLDKVYEATGVLGVQTTTLDADGDIVAEQPVEADREDLEGALARFTGEIDQIPPQVSAVKVGGERAYARAARGERVHLEARRVFVRSIELLAYDPPAFDVRIRCSSGTYVRSLVDDVGEALGCGAHVRRLRRVRVGHLDVADAVPLEGISAEALIEVDRALAHLPTVELDADGATRAGHGQRIERSGPDGEVLVLGPEGAVGVFESRDGILRAVTVLGPPGRSS